jgi:hypothetical protein
MPGGLLEAAVGARELTHYRPEQPVPPIVHDPPVVRQADQYHFIILLLSSALFSPSLTREL